MMRTRSVTHFLQVMLALNLLISQVVASQNKEFGNCSFNRISSYRTGYFVSSERGKLAFLVQAKKYRRCPYATRNNNLHRRYDVLRTASRSTNTPRSHLISRSHEDDFEANNSRIQPASKEVTRRTILFNLISLSLLTQIPSEAQSSSQIDATGQLYSPKNEMLSQGGSAAARGIKLPRKERKSSGKNNNLLSTGGLIQDVYETRFVTYLTRFLLVFDPASSAWWKVCPMDEFCLLNSRFIRNEC